MAVNRILKQWDDLKDHFKMACVNEKCYMAELLLNMFSDVNNQLILIFLQPILAEAQRVNKAFQSNAADPCKLLQDLIMLIESLANMVTVTGCKADLVTCNVNDFLHPHPVLGDAFETG